MTLSIGESILIIAVVAVCTFATRVLPFVLFGGSNEVSGKIRYLGAVLPPAIIATLVIYCLKNINFLQYPSGISEIISVVLVAALHIWRRNTLLSIGVGTACYMLLVQLVFV